MCGECLISLAWNRRGGGYADSVTDEGWEGFRQNLAEAAGMLERSWDLDPKNTATALAMMKVELGQGEGRSRMEFWFRRASGLKDAHWRQPGVWEDVEASFDRFFALNPDAVGWRHDYAFYAFKCGQPGRFLDQLPEMRGINYPYFGGRAAFEAMVREAEASTGRQAELPAEPAKE